MGNSGGYDRTSLNCPFGIPCMVSILSYCIWWGSECISGELGNQFLSMNLTGLKYVSQGAVQAVVVSNVEYNLCGTAV